MLHFTHDVGARHLVERAAQVEVVGRRMGASAESDGRVADPRSPTRDDVAVAEDHRALERSAARARCPATRTPAAPRAPPASSVGTRLPQIAGSRSRKCRASSGDVVAALAQRRNRDRNHRQPVVEILAEAPLGHLGAGGPVGGGDDAHVDPTRPVPPTRSNSRVSSTRRSLAWIDSGSSPISSRNSVPPSAGSNARACAASRR